MGDNLKRISFINTPENIGPAIIFENFLAQELHITVEPDVNEPGKDCWHQPAYPLDLTPLDPSLGKPYPGSIKTMICKDGARPKHIGIPGVVEKRIQTIILHNEHRRYLDTAAFPNLRAIVCREDDDIYAATHLDRAGCDLSDRFTTECAIYRQQAEIHRQIMPQLPGWMQALVLDPASKVELSIRITLDFRSPEEESPASFYWDGEQIREVEQPSWFVPLCILYSWRAGRSYWTLQPPRDVGLVFHAASGGKAGQE
ncbi:hypothetical protein AYO21_10171 [Fonsecaea monophora]|uniref:Uncharacterized protein n=1 Tax=Fonsecaea monophora TaxID=254056 RepID=A0A177EW60_9EURO|nr:hypothetical protein AYO21_10171 [Fonsecaea monophora]KAH0829863.1 hypothetical protein FOPE_10694 [Fonsecaea pedrosoi]OAG35631.1 hypothetical protein AYO21_10171 [Fonsecaea monophora]